QGNRPPAFPARRVVLMLTFYSSTPTGRKWRRATVTLGHATLSRNFPSILRDGILTANSRGRYKAVWLHESDKAHWAALHTVRRHGGRFGDVVVIEVTVPKAWLRQGQGTVTLRAGRAGAGRSAGRSASPSSRPARSRRENANPQ